VLQVTVTSAGVFRILEREGQRWDGYLRYEFTYLPIVTFIKFLVNYYLESKQHAASE